jgi:hypothetical protein
MNELQQRLAQPFEPKYIEWKPGGTTKDNTKCMAMAYADLRAYQERLDEVCGMDWAVRYVGWGDTRIFCELTIAGVTRTSTGESDAQDAKNGLAGTVAEAQSFKRAAAMFGLGRYLYDLPSAWVEFDSQYKRISDKGKAELESRYQAWYARTIAQTRQDACSVAPNAQSSTPAANAPQQPATQPVVAANPFDDTTPYFVHAWHKLTGKEYDLVQWTSSMHKTSDGPCTARQYQYLSGLVDALTANQHGYVLSLLCQADVTKSNLPGKKVAAALIKLIAPTVKSKDEQGNDVDVPNPDYRQDIADMLAALAQPQPA